MGPKKKMKPNGYIVFMMEKKNELERKGEKFPGGIGDPKLQSIASPLWTALSPDRQAYYKAKAKKVDVVEDAPKYDNKGVPIIVKERAQQAQTQVKIEMWSSIEETVMKLYRAGELVNYSFHFAHFNHLVATDENQWLPCEVALVKYSLVGGITEFYQEFIDPGPIPLGYSYEAKDHSEQTHKINPATFNKLNKNYPLITDKIKSILTTNDGRIAPLYVLESDMPRTLFMVQWLVNESCKIEPLYDRRNPFVVFNMDKLFYELRRYADLNNPRLVFPSILIARNKLCSHEFDYSPNMACEWHEENDNSKNCSLTAVRRHAYVISDMCCENYNLRLLPNRHCPAELVNEDMYLVQAPVARPNPTIPSFPKAHSSVSSSLVDDPEPEPRRPAASSQVSRLAARFGTAEGSAGKGVVAIPAPTGEMAGVAGANAVSVGGASVATLSPAPVGRGRGRGLLSQM